MPYEPDTPQAQVWLSDSQPQIQENFEVYQNAFSTQHYDFGDALQGKHKHVGFVARDANTVPATGASDCALYSRQDTLTNNPLDRDVLTFKRDSNGEIYQFGLYRATRFGNFPDPNDLTAVFPRSTGFTLLPSGMLIKWDSIYTVNTTGGDLAYTFYRSNITVPFTSIYSVFVSVASKNNNDTTDINVAAYVHNWTITAAAETVNIKLWRRNGGTIFPTAGTDQAPFRLNILAFGKGPVA